MENKKKIDTYLVEDHHQVLDIWRKQKINNIDLIHIDAHIDFEVFNAPDITSAFYSSRSVAELKKNLENTLCFIEYEPQINKQTDIGNYIYPAMMEKIINDFWWIIPGCRFQLNKNFNLLNRIIKDKLKNKNVRLRYKKEGIFYCQAMNHNFYITTLDALPPISNKVLLDIDCDFLVINDIRHANNTYRIGQRRPWIIPSQLHEVLSSRLQNIHLATIAYSVNGGFTPIKYRNFGDELAYLFNAKYRTRYIRAKAAEKMFRMFNKTNNAKWYRKACKLDTAYSTEYNNYGPLYLQKNRLTAAEKEFKCILSADKNNVHCLLNMANILMRKKDYMLALRYLDLAKKYINKKNNLLISIDYAQIYFYKKAFTKAKNILLELIKRDTLNPKITYYLGRIYETEQEYQLAAEYYRHTIRLGFARPEIFMRILRTALKLGNDKKTAIINFVLATLKKIVVNDKKSICQVRKYLQKVKIS